MVWGGAFWPARLGERRAEWSGWVLSEGLRYVGRGKVSWRLAWLGMGRSGMVGQAWCGAVPTGHEGNGQARRSVAGEFWRGRARRGLVTEARWEGVGNGGQGMAWPVMVSSGRRWQGGRGVVGQGSGGYVVDRLGGTPEHTGPAERT